MVFHIYVKELKAAATKSLAKLEENILLTVGNQVVEVIREVLIIANTSHNANDILQRRSGGVSIVQIVPCRKHPPHTCGRFDHMALNPRRFFFFCSVHSMKENSVL